MAHLHSAASIFNISLRARLAVLVSLSVLAIAPTAPAQTFTVLHELTGSQGNQLVSGLSADREDNLYGAAFAGGLQNCSGQGCGTVFKLAHKGTGWVFSVLYTFTGISDGWGPGAPVLVAPDGSIYGTTSLGGTGGCDGVGCGTVFHLQPPPRVCVTASCPWTKTILHQFTFGHDGAYPLGALILDQAGNLYSTATNSSGQQNQGTVWELSPSNGGWTFSTLYEFQPGSGSGWPTGGLIFDRQGNLWGTGGYGGALECSDPQLPNYCGSLYELTLHGSSWTEITAFSFTSSTGGGPGGSLVLDPSGNLYGTLLENGPQDGGGVFQFQPAGGQLNVIWSVSGLDGNQTGPEGGMVVDQNGNLFGADPYTGTLTSGFVFELTPSGGNWTFTNLHGFTGGSDGEQPYGPLVLDSAGNVYGASSNTIFEITP